MSTPTKAAIRSFILTFLITLIPALFAPDVDWTVKGLVPLLLAAGRTALAYAVPGGLYGIKPVDLGREP